MLQDSCKRISDSWSIWVSSHLSTMCCLSFCSSCAQCIPIYLLLGYSLKYHAYELIHGIICDMCIPNLYHIFCVDLQEFEYKNVKASLL